MKLFRRKITDLKCEECGECENAANLVGTEGQTGNFIKISHHNIRHQPYSLHSSLMKPIALYIMAVLYIAAGTMHFVKPLGYVRIVPPWIPSPFLLVAVFPANIQMMLNYFHYSNHWKWLTVLRLPLQAVLIWWAWMYTRN